MSLPVAIKSEPSNEDESFDSKFFDDNSNSDMRSFASENSDSALHDMDSSSCNGDMGNMQDGSLLAQHADEIEGEKLNDSLTLPIPAYSGEENTKSESETSSTPKIKEEIKSEYTPTDLSTSSVSQNQPLQIDTLASHLKTPDKPLSGMNLSGTPSPILTTPSPSGSGSLLSSPPTTFPLPARPPAVNLEKRERDESWKNYLLR